MEPDVIPINLDVSDMANLFDAAVSGSLGTPSHEGGAQFLNSAGIAA